ncbi:MAG: type II secretion system F family protein [Candidatus Colwellbacteria bacterium]|nr:type II secretion system F family protein [Candidatus Colwellbacteria bacterium]
MQQDIVVKTKSSDEKAAVPPRQGSKRPKKHFEFSFLLPTKVPLNELLLFSKHLSLMLKSGMSEIESIKIIRNQIKSRGFGKILDKVGIDLENGQFLSESLSKYKGTFGELFVGVIKLGEISGTLPENLEYLAVETKKKSELHAKVRSALIYPMVILVATLSVSGGLVFFVLPKIMPIFTSLKVELPITTKILISSANFIQQYYIYIGIGLVVFIIGFALLLRIKVIKYVYHRMILLIPIFGTMAKHYNMANITRTLGLLLKSGTKIVEAISATSDTVANLVYKESLKKAAEEVTRGEALYKRFDKHPSLFPPTVTRMVQIGEQTGNLDSNLAYLSEFYENELDGTVKNLSSVLEPILMVVMGLLVGFVAISIIMPIYEVTQGIRPTTR